jgi:hypothetical protein
MPSPDMQRLMNAAVDTELDCYDWNDAALEELCRAIVTALREPSNAMAVAVGDQWGCGLEHDYKAMLDVVLAP